MKKRRILLIAGISLLGCTSALAAIYLPSGQSYTWAGMDSQGNPLVNMNGQTVRAHFNENGRAVPNSGISASDASFANGLGSYHVGGDSQFNHIVDTVPVFTNGVVSGSANVFDNDQNLGRSYYTTGSNTGSWTNQAGNATWGGSRIDFTSPESPNHSPMYNPPPSPPSPPAPANLLRNSSIEHNAAWEAVRIKNNRTQAQFYAGEEIVVQATTSNDATAVRATFHFPQAVKDVSPAFLEPSDSARPDFSATFELTKEDQATWKGTFWKKSWVAIPDGNYRVTITTTYPNGQTQSVEQTIQMQGSVLDFIDGIEKMDQ